MSSIIPIERSVVRASKIFPIYIYKICKTNTLKNNYFIYYLPSVI